MAINVTCDARTMLLTNKSGSSICTTYFGVIGLHIMMQVTKVQATWDENRIN
jgi:hypothetical protein